MLRTLLTPFSPAPHKQSTTSVATMLVTSHDINFVMGFIKEEEIFTTVNATNTTAITSSALSTKSNCSTTSSSSSSSSASSVSSVLQDNVRSRY